MSPELIIQMHDGTTRVFPLDRSRITLGRSLDNDLAYPEDPVLSRHHLLLEQSGADWWAQDLGSKNGTLVNGARLQTRCRLSPGDRMAAGRVILTFRAGEKDLNQTVMFIAEDATQGTSVSTRLENVVGAKEPESLSLALRTPALAGTPRMQALLDAGRELAGDQPLAELFAKILDLAVNSVGARRGVLLTLENDELVARAARGDSFRISRAVRDRVMNKDALLIADASLDEALRKSLTLVGQNVKSLIAVPLQSGDRVIGLIYVDSPEVVRPFTRDDLTLLTVMANIAAIRIEHARLREVEQTGRALSKELEQAAEIQRNLLPVQAPSIEGIDLAGMSIACRSVGGDYFDYVRLPGGRWGVIVGDVAGKGLPAALLMSSLQARVQVLAEENTDLATLISRLNRSVAGGCPDNRFITFFMCAIDAATGEFEYCNAGHNPPYLFHTDATHEMLHTGGPVLGIIRDFPYASGHGVLRPGESLTMFSDGVTEARSPEGEEFGEDGLVAQLERCHRLPAEQMMRNVYGAVEHFMGAAPAADDITVVVLRRN
jgi:phosphoserine phosphatase RsbU/P